MLAYRTRRNKLISHMLAMGGGIAIIPTANEHIRNGDADFPYRHDSNFYYLSGFTESDAILVLIAAEQSKAILFCKEKNLEREIWDGYRFGPEAACSHFGLDAAFPISALDTEMPKLLANIPAIFSFFGKYFSANHPFKNWLDQLDTHARSGATKPHTMHDLAPLLAEMRLFKDQDEQAIMQHAGNITTQAHCRAMRMAQPGLREYHLEAELLHEFRMQGAQSPAYNSIVASGANACVLHYRADNAVLKEGDLVLIDAGCEFDSYASDVTRTFPANGVFSGPQSTLYQIVLEAQQAAIAAILPGLRYIEAHQAAVHVLAQGMLDTGLLDKNKVGLLDDVISNGDYRQFYMHSTGHWLGLDVHDVGAYRENTSEKAWRRLEPGMVTTVEPGIYVRPAPGVPEQYWNIGIRIEDDILVTPDGNHNFTSAAPTTISDIEALMRK